MSWTVKADTGVLEELEEYGYTSPIVLDAIGLLQFGVVLEDLGYDMGGCNPDVTIKDNVLEIKKEIKRDNVTHRDMIDEWMN